MFNTELLHPGNLILIAVTAILSIVAWNIVTRKFSIFTPLPSPNANVTQVPN